MDSDVRLEGRAIEATAGDKSQLEKGTVCSVTISVSAFPMLSPSSSLIGLASFLSSLYL